MQVDSLVLGRVKSVSKFHLDVCLPHGQVGRVNIYEISDKYTELLKEIISSGEPNNNVASLNQLFKVGQIVRGCMKSNATDATENSSSRGRLPTELSLNPKLVNKGVLRRHLSLKIWLVGAVVTEEDHGFMVDIGIPEVECFLPKNHIKDKLFMGQLITVSPITSDALSFAASKDSRVLTVSSLLENVDSVLNPLLPIHFGCLLPGAWLKGVIHSKVSSTLVIKFCDYMISVNRAHYKGSEEEYTQDKEVIVCLLIVDPGTKQLTGSLLPHLLPPNCTLYETLSSCDTIQIGSKFPNAVVERVDKRTVHVRLHNMNNVQGVIRKAHIPEKMKSDNLKSKFSVGQRINCRVIDHDLLENVAVATMKKKLLRLPYLSISEISPGDKVNAEIVRFTKTGIVVRVEERLSGLVPFLHLADMPIKRPAEKFARGQKLVCCVLNVDTANNKLILTAKRGLVEATCPLLGSKEMLKSVSETGFLQDSVDHLFAAFVAKVSERGLLLIGLDGLRAWLPKKESGLSEDDALEATFFHGQVLRVRILRCLKPKTGEGNSSAQFLVSLKLKGSEETTQKNRKPKLSDSPSIGQIFNAKINKVQTSGIIVDLLAPEDPNNANGTSQTLGTGFLRFDHLTDYETNVPLLTHCVSNLKRGATLSLDGTDPRQVVVINQTNKMTLVSAKPTLLRAAKDLQKTESNESSEVIAETTGFVRNFSDLRVGSQYFAWIQNHVDFGVFVHFPAGIPGLAPVRLLSDTRIPAKTSMTDVFPPGATVVAKVVELAPLEKRRCLVSLRMMDTYIAEELYADGAIRSLRTWLTEQEWISIRQEALSTYRIGDLVNFRITNSDALVAVGEACKRTRSGSASSSKKTTWVSALVYRENADGIECAVGQLCEGVVTFVDYLASRLELALSSWLLNSINHRKDQDEACAVHPGQKVSSVTVAIRHRDAAVVAFRGHAAGRFGIVPARRTFNDVVGGNAWALGQRNQVTLRTPFKQQSSGPDLYLCTLSIYDPIITTTLRTTAAHSKHDISLEEASSSNQQLTLSRGTQLTGLRLNRIVGQIIFLQLDSSPNHLVFCRAVNWDQTSKAVRAFLSHPPASGTEINRTATVLFAASDDTGGRGGLHSRLPEVSFLEKNHIDVGDLICARLLHVARDHWTLRLPGDAHGWLHVTAMHHAKQPQPICLESTDAGLAIVHQVKDLGTDLSKNRLITCRVVDRFDQGDRKNSNQTSSPLYYVCTNPAVVNGGLEFWKSKQPSIGQITDAFVKTRSPHGLLVSVTHMDDMLIPITSTLSSQLRKAKIGFRVGDHLLVRPVRMMENQLVGELVFENAMPSVDSEDLDRVTTALIQHVALKTDRARKRLENLKRTRDRLQFFDEPSAGEKRDADDQITDLSSTTKKPRLTEPASTDESLDDSTVPLKRQNTQPSEAFEYLGTDQDTVQRYADFMLPAEYEFGDIPEPVQPNTVNIEQADVANLRSNDDLSTIEWRLHETEQRKAMLAALTTAQHYLPKGVLRPATTEEFELAVRNAPSNASCWTAYMTHVLAGTGKETSVNEARAIAERGLRAIANAPGLAPGEQELQQARLLLVYLILEAKELERCTQEKEAHILYRLGSDPVLELNDQANRLSQVLSRLVNLDRAEFTSKAIEAMVDIGQFERAEDLARRLIKSCPQDVDRWLSLIKVRFRAGRVAAAREAQRNAVSIVRSAELPRLLTGVARLEFKFGDADRSLTLLREQLTAYPKQRLVYEEFIKVFLMAGKKSEANSVKEKAKEMLKPRDYEVVDSVFNSHLQKVSNA